MTSAAVSVQVRRPNMGAYQVSDSQEERYRSPQRRRASLSVLPDWPTPTLWLIVGRRSREVVFRHSAALHCATFGRDAASFGVDCNGRTTGHAAGRSRIVFVACIPDAARHHGASEVTKV